MIMCLAFQKVELFAVLIVSGTFTSPPRTARIAERCVRAGCDWLDHYRRVGLAQQPQP